MRARRLIAFALALLTGAGIASAHDHWLSADQLNLAPGDKLTLHLQLGEDLQSPQEQLLVSKDVERFELLHGNVVDNLFEQGHDGGKPLWSQAPDFEGEFLAVMTRGRQQIELERQQFISELAEEQVSGITPTSRPMQRLRYWRFLKLLGRIGGDEEGSLHHRFIGQQLELVLIQNPVLLKPGDEEIVQLYLETKPLPNQVVFALHRDGDKFTRLMSTTDARGVARFRLNEPGVWVVRTVYLRACKKCGDADWEGFWSDYTFELGP
ncbi:MAG TPA: DUF4198 domain-containing protein [Steroidobacteraceae bacterium]|nr:DUF4198 domain-containing protein [Steroidobacteraceae bacterium]